MTHIEIIRKACIESNPEIMELKFGCGVKLEVKEYDTIWGKVLYKRTNIRHGTDIDHWKIISDEGQVLSWNIDREGMTILGRPIRLADVLLAIGKDEEDVAYHAPNCSIPRWKLIHSDITGSASGWNLREDDLSKQTPETLEFLAGLLSK